MFYNTVVSTRLTIKTTYVFKFTLEFRTNGSEGRLGTDPSNNLQDTLGLGESMVAKLKLQKNHGRAPTGVEPVAYSTIFQISRNE